MTQVGQNADVFVQVSTVEAHLSTADMRCYTDVQVLVCQL